MFETSLLARWTRTAPAVGTIFAANVGARLRELRMGQSTGILAGSERRDRQGD
jgi:hypothetical protein